LKQAFAHNAGVLLKSGSKEKVRKWETGTRRKDERGRGWVLEREEEKSEEQKRELKRRRKRRTDSYTNFRSK
jgi:hypothetical protein